MTLENRWAVPISRDRNVASPLEGEWSGRGGAPRTVVLTKGMDGHLAASRSDDSHVLQYLRIEIGWRIKEAMSNSQF